MINIVFEGSTGSGKTTIIRKLVNYYSEKYKVGYTNDIDKSSPLYSIIKTMFDETPLIFSDEKFNTLKYETFIQAADYLYLKEKIYKEDNFINFFDRNYSSVFSYQSVLFSLAKVKNYKYFMKNVLNCMKFEEKEINLMVFFDLNFNKTINRAELRDNRKFTKKEKEILKKFNIELKNFIRYNNSEYNLLVITDKDNTEEKIFNKIKMKIDEIIKDKKNKDQNKWYELYKIDVEEFESADKYIKYKLNYKKKFIKIVKKYAKKNKKILEAGCGTGLLAGYFQKEGMTVTALDLNKKILDYAAEIARKSKIISECSEYKQGNILDLKNLSKDYEIIYSNGVLEHFNDEEIVKILKSELNFSKYVIFGVPSTYFNMNEKMLGNERSLTIKEWKNLIEKADADLIEINDFHYYNFFKRFFEIKKWFKPKAFWIFVLTKKNQNK